MTLTRSLDTAAAIRRIDTDRDDLLALDVAGVVTPADAENLYGLLEGAYALHPQVDVLVRLVDYESTDWRELNRDTLADGRARAVQHVRRCAIVGGPDFSAKLALWLPGDGRSRVRHFVQEEEEAAWTWIHAQPTDEDQNF